MVMDEILQVLADDEHVKQLLVNDLVVIYSVSFWIVDVKQELRVLTRSYSWRSHRQLHRILDLILNAEHQLHSAARANSRFVGTNVFVHGTNVVLGAGGSGNRSGSLTSNLGAEGDHAENQDGDQGPHT